MLNICTVPIVTGLIEATSYVAHMCRHLPYKSIKYLAYMPNLVGIFVSSTYLAVIWEVCIAVGCVLTHMCKNVGSIYPFDMLHA